MRMIIQGSSWHSHKSQSSVSSVALVETGDLGLAPWRNEAVGFRVLRPTPAGEWAEKKFRASPGEPAVWMNKDMESP